MKNPLHIIIGLVFVLLGLAAGPRAYAQAPFALAVFFLAFVVYQGRTRQLRTRKRELEALVETRTLDLRTAEEKIEAQAEKLQEIDRFKDRFFANV